MENTNTNTTKTIPTLMQLVSAVGNDDNEFMFTVTKPMVHKPSITTVGNGKVLARTNVVVAGVEKYLTDKLGDDVALCRNAKNPDEIWIEVKAWEGKATRFFNVFEKNGVAKLPLVLMGSIRLNPWKDANDRQRATLTLSLSDFTVAYGIPRKQAQSEESANAASSKSEDAMDGFSSVVDNGNEQEAY